MTKLLIFLFITVACVIGAAIRVQALGNPVSTAHEHTSGQSSFATPVLLEYTARGTAKASQRVYRFRICEVEGEYRAYIQKSPSYRNRATDISSTHRHYDGQYYVCWSNPIRNYNDMVNVAKTWADCTQRYIEFGTRF